MSRQIMAVAVFLIAGLAAFSYAGDKGQPVIVDIGQGASVYGPLRVNDSSGRLVLDIPAGSWVVSAQ